MEVFTDHLLLTDDAAGSDGAKAVAIVATIARHRTTRRRGVAMVVEFPFLETFL